MCIAMLASYNWQCRTLYVLCHNGKCIKPLFARTLPQLYAHSTHKVQHSTHKVRHSIRKVQSTSVEHVRFAPPSAQYCIAQQSRNQYGVFCVPVNCLGTHLLPCWACMGALVCSHWCVGIGVFALVCRHWCVSIGVLAFVCLHWCVCIGVLALCWHCVGIGCLPAVFFAVFHIIGKARPRAPV
jgi:hypothetical protein